MEDSPNLDLSELLKMFGKYRRRLNSTDPAQEELYDALKNFDIAVVKKTRQLREIYWNVLQKQTLTYQQKAYQISLAVEEWTESPESKPFPLPSELYEEFTIELHRPRNLPSWGISIIGGEGDPDGPGIYISEINDNSIAQAGNLLPQDRIVEVNGGNTREVDHDVATRLLSQKNTTLVIKISRSMSSDEPGSQIDILDVYLQRDNPIKGFGIKIKGGRNNRLIADHDGIFITHVSGVAADNAQLDKGDRIISANGTNLEHVDKEEAMSVITSNQHMLHLKVQKRALLQIQQHIPNSCIREVFLRSLNGSYGLSIGGTEGKIYVTRFLPGGAAEKNGHVFLGDQLMTIGENSTLNCSTDQALRYLQNYPLQVNIKLIQGQREYNSLVNAGLLCNGISHSSTRDSMYIEPQYYRVRFDYNPTQDKGCPNGLELREGDIVKIDDFGDTAGTPKHRLIDMDYKCFTATLVEDSHERLGGSIPSLHSLQQGRYPGVTLPRGVRKKNKWLPLKKAEIRRIWKEHRFYEQIWKIERDETRIILIVGALNELLVDILIRERPDTYQTLITLPPGEFDFSIDSPFATACKNILSSRRHVLLAIGPELLSDFFPQNTSTVLSHIVIAISPTGVHLGDDMEAASGIDGLLDPSQLDQAQQIANQVRNDFPDHVSGLATGSNLGEIYYEVCSLISENSYKKISWNKKEPEWQQKTFTLSESFDCLEIDS